MTTTDVPRIDSGTVFFCSWSGGKDCCLALELSAEVVVRSNLRKEMDVNEVDSRSVFSEDRLRG